YTAVRLDFDLVGAVHLALTQIGVCALVIVLASALNPVPAALGRSVAPRWRDGPAARLVQGLVLFLGLVGFALPLLAVLADGLVGGLGRVLGQAAFWSALATSLFIGTASALLTLALALVVALGRAAAGSALAR